MRFLICLMICGLVYSSTVAAEIYRWKDSAGNTVFSDTPHPGAEVIEVSEPTIVPAGPTATPSASESTPKPAAQAYDAVLITQPSNEETIRENIADIDVSVSVEPRLQTDFGHRLKLLFDGAQVAEPGVTTSFMLPNVDRGAHPLEAVVVGPDGRDLERSATTTFFVHKFAIKKTPR